ncbi:MAG: portal protein [Candidatus Poseidoniales archaeon]
MDDGVTVAAGGLQGYGVDLDGSGGNKEAELIRKYRCMALHPEVDSAIEDIVNEAIVSDTNDTPVAIDLSNLDISERIKTIIREEFAYILHLLDFNNKSHEMFRKWFIDGRLFYHKVIDLNQPERGMTDIRHIDAMKIKLVREYNRDVSPRNPILKNTNKPLSGNESKVFGQATRQMPARVVEYFLYNKKGMSQLNRSFGSMNQMGQNETVKIARDAVTYITSGLTDGNTGQVMSYLNKAQKSLNQLRWMEDAIVIYRMARAPERRLFYIDVGNLPKAKAEQYLRDTMARYRTKISYDQSTGEIRDDKRYMSMLEDYWLPRREGGRGTEVSTLPGGQNLGNLEDLKYFQDKLYRSLNVPISRQDAGSGFQIGKSDNIMRDEVKFAKFVGRLRKRFSMLFVDLLKTQLVLKGVCSPKEYDSMKEHIQFDFIYDNHFAELREMEIMQNRLTIAAQCEPYVGKYFSVYQVRNRLLGYTDGEIKEIDQQVSYERNVGIIPDPNAQLLQQRGAAMGANTAKNMQGAELSADFQGDPNAGPEGDMDLG